MVEKKGKRKSPLQRVRFANDAASGVAADLLISALVFWVWSYFNWQDRVSGITDPPGFRNPAGL
jgi:hypothetical protein